MKPTKRVLQNVSMTASKILRKCVKQLIKIVGDEKEGYSIITNTEYSKSGSSRNRMKKQFEMQIQQLKRILMLLFHYLKQNCLNWILHEKQV